MNQSTSIEALYDTYSPMLYGIALEISPTQIGAEEILIRTFQKIDKLKLVDSNQPIQCISLIKLAIQAAHELFGSLPKLRQFESTPILHKLLCEQMSLDKFCEEKEIDITEATKMFRAEFALIRKLNVPVRYSVKSKYG